MSPGSGVSAVKLNESVFSPGASLPLASLSLFVPPLRLVSAALWQVVQRRVIKDYGLLEEFVTSVLEIVPDLMSHRERVQLIMGLQARVRVGFKPNVFPQLLTYNTVSAPLS